MLSKALTLQLPLTLVKTKKFYMIFLHIQSQCINNWFRLTVGLINKDYKEKETTRRAQQMLYIRNREAFIDEQMENAKCNNDPKFGEVEQRTNILHNLVVRHYLYMVFCRSYTCTPASKGSLVVTIFVIYDLCIFMICKCQIETCVL